MTKDGLCRPYFVGSQLWQRLFDRAVGGGFHVLKDEKAHSARKTAHPIMPRPWWFEPHGTIDVGQQAVVGAAESERDLPEPIPDRQLDCDRSEPAIDADRISISCRSSRTGIRKSTQTRKSASA
jgi:hypothetical protein